MLKESDNSFPQLRQVVLDATDARRLAEFYRRLLGYTFRAGGEPRGGDQHGVSGRDWLGLHEPVGTSRIAFQQVSSLKESTWPDGHVPAQLHLDLTVPDRQMLDLQHERARRLGARLLEDRSDDTGESLRVYADPSGHPSSQA